MRALAAAAGWDLPPQPLIVELSLAGEGGRTTLCLVHSGFGPKALFDAEFDGISRGWPGELWSLRLYLERHLAWSVAELERCQLVELLEESHRGNAH